MTCIFNQLLPNAGYIYNKNFYRRDEVSQKERTYDEITENIGATELQSPIELIYEDEITTCHAKSTPTDKTCNMQVNPAYEESIMENTTEPSLYI